ncbi:MAG: hypothetical protein DRI75_06810 [Bacteroidetes bacterium]|nr:MAG: hypothetical protein DRI75_06810 [Bacteroidota bacterium]
MEKLFIIKYLTIFILFIFISHNFYAQNELFVYRFLGEPYLEINDSIKPVTKGSIIDKNTILTMNMNDDIQVINEKGDIFHLVSTGDFSHNDLLKIPMIKNTNSYVKKYFTYIWKEFTNNVVTRHNKSGVVYRGDDIVLMSHPADSIKIYYPEINFEWKAIKDKTKEYYFILKNLDSGEITKIGTLSTSLSLFVDGTILKEGDNYEWTITETKYPNFNKTTFYSFKLLNTSEFDAMEQELEGITKFLKNIGLSKNEIREAICLDYNICF